MRELENPKLKQAVCVCNDLSHRPLTKRYVVETEEDLEAFFVGFPSFDIMNVKQNLLDCIERGSVILLSDPHPASGLNTYCTEHQEGLCRADATLLNIKTCYDAFCQIVGNGNYDMWELEMGDTFRDEHIISSCHISDNQMIVIPPPHFMVVLPVRVLEVDKQGKSDQEIREMFEAYFGEEMKCVEGFNFIQDQFFRAGLHTEIVKYKL